MTGDYSDFDLETIARLVQRAKEGKWETNRKIRLLEALLVTACQLLSSEHKDTEQWSKRYTRWKERYDKYLENGIDFVPKP